ncbi:MAG TPA: glycosyltransferase [Ureibacillus sp.]|nr:glycosyltransferase [Ureibacillus sp.]
MKKTDEILTTPLDDRRILSNVPDPEKIRQLIDRRGFMSDSSTKFLDTNELLFHRKLGQRYIVDFPIHRIYSKKHGPLTGEFLCRNISNTGILISAENTNNLLLVGQRLTLTFEIPGGAMPEGYESKVTISGTVVRVKKETIDGKPTMLFAINFDKSLNKYLKKRRWGYSLFISSLLLFLITFIIVLMRSESVIYFKFNQFLYFYSLVAASFLLSRYLFGMLYKKVKTSSMYEPGVSIIIPVFNEEKWISRTILSCIDQAYPIDKLEVIIVDDYSTDRTAEKVRETMQRIHSTGEKFNTKERIQFYVQPVNKGKREALIEGVKLAKHDLVVFVDSDSFLEPTAIRNIVQPFQDPKMGGVAGRTEVENKYTNALTKLQTVRYYIAFRIMKAAEACFDCVTCLSGPLSCYRKDLVLENAEAWLNQKFLGHPATFGDDRSLTNFILKTHRTSYQDNAVCSTIVPSSYNTFIKQQMRWKRSWLRESLRALSFMWRKEPFMFLFFIIGFIVPIAAPIVVLYNLIYVPIVHHIFPITFLVGLLLMALLMSFTHLFFKKSTLWSFGIFFVIYYEFVLLWQMPVAWVTFWKSTWGTRDTPQDILERERKIEKKMRKMKKYPVYSGKE